MNPDENDYEIYPEAGQIIYENCPLVYGFRVSGTFIQFCSDAKLTLLYVSGN